MEDANAASLSCAVKVAKAPKRVSTFDELGKG